MPHNRFYARAQLVVCVITVILLFAIGYYPSPLCQSTPEQDFQVEAEYFSGILGASSILFGLWIITLGKKPVKRSNTAYEVAVENFLYCFLFLVLSVITVALTAVNLFSPPIALLLNTGSFCTNASFLIIPLYYFKMKKSSD